MGFIEFISNLSEEDKLNFNKYSKIRDEQQYHIIYEVLKRENVEPRYIDVNSFIKYDKAIKDVLYKYLGTLEEYLKTIIFKKYEFENVDNLKNKPYRTFRELPKVIEKDIAVGEITELYKKFALNFGDIIKFGKDYSCFENINELEEIKELRDKVMHHLPILFNCDFTSTIEKTKNHVSNLLKVLPKDYVNGLKDELTYLLNATKKNINSEYRKFLLEV